MNAKQRKINQKASDAAEAKVVAEMAEAKEKRERETKMTEAKEKISAARAEQAGKGKNGKGKTPAVVLVQDKVKNETKVNKVETKKAAKDAGKSDKISCPCGCGVTAEGRGIFLPGHDGRLVGWLLAVASGEEKRINKIPADRKALAVDAHARWVKAGRPGEQHHPKVRSLFG
jgi:hypothetical protein